MKIILRILLLYFFTLGSFFINANKKVKDKYIGLFYFNEVYGLIHQMPSIDSVALSTVSCGRRLKVYEKTERPSKDFYFVKKGKTKGYVQKEYLSKRWPKHCVRNRYKHFFKELNLDSGDHFYWGKLYDRFRIGRTKAQ